MVDFQEEEPYLFLYTHFLKLKKCVATFAVVVMRVQVLLVISGYCWIFLRNVNISVVVNIKIQ
jgi:hypothetical protein